MNEQQRVNLAIFLCLALFTAYYFLMPAQVPTQPPAPTPVEEPARPEAPTVPEVGMEAAPPGEEAQPDQPPERKLTFETQLLRGELSNQTMGLSRLELKDYDERPEDNGEPRPVSLVMGRGTADDDFPDTRDVRLDQARIEWLLGGTPLPRPSIEQVGGSIHMAATGVTGVATRVEVTPRPDAYALDYVLRLENNAAQSLPAGAKVTLSLRSTGDGGSWFTPPSDLVQGICARNSDISREAAKGLRSDGSVRHGPPISFAGIDRQYFVVATVPALEDGLAEARCEMRADDDIVLVDVEFPERAVAPGGTWEQRYTVFLGPKRAESLRAVSPLLTEVIDYNIGFIPLGFLARPMVFLLNVFHGWTSSWGAAIILLTLFVKLLLFPITLKSSLSMRKMQLLRPEMDRIRKQFENDRERQQMEQLKLFREKGVNPVGGCLPMLLQMPVWFALYRSLWTAVDLYQQPFLWVQDLTAPESFPFLAISFAVLTVIQQRLTPMTMDNQQAKVIMYVMPVAFALFMISFPSGLVLYIVVNSVLTIFQQLAINSRQVTL